MENKYYIPTIEELLKHIIDEKFIYTHLNPSSNDGNMVEIRFESDTVNSIHFFIEVNDVDGNIYSINTELYRIKYLDQEDIESLELKYTGKATHIWFEKEGSFNMGSWTSYKIRLHYGLRDQRMFIVALDSGDEYTIFQGIVKNKSELKQVLKMIGVIE